MTRAVVLTIGDEIVLGQINDTNSTYICEALSSAGIQVVMKLTVGDLHADIWQALTFAFSQAEVVVVTGGLGPTKDDLTKPILAQWFKSEMAYHPTALAHIEDLLRKRGREMNELVKAQALQPTKSEYLHNAVGTAPGLWFAEEGKICVALPGVPYEMKQLMEDEVLPRLKKRLQLDVILHRFIRTVGVPETALAQRITAWEDALPPHLKLAYLPGGGQVKLRITGRSHSETELKKELESQTLALIPLIEEYVYATEDVELETVVAQLIQFNNIQVFIDDRLSEGILTQKFQAFPEIQNQMVANAIDYTSFVPAKNAALLSLQPITEGGSQKAEAMLGHKTMAVEVKPFSHPQVNKLIVSLAVLNLLRKIILSEYPSL